MDTSCDLCRLVRQRNIYTPLHFEDDRIIIVDCDTCDVPMVVAKQHGVPVPATIESWMEQKLTEVSDKVLGANKYRITTDERRILDHRHFHARRTWMW